MSNKKTTLIFLSMISMIFSSASSSDDTTNPNSTVLIPEQRLKEMEIKQQLKEMKIKQKQSQINELKAMELMNGAIPKLEEMNNMAAKNTKSMLENAKELKELGEGYTKFTEERKKFIEEQQTLLKKQEQWQEQKDKRVTEYLDQKEKELEQQQQKRITENTEAKEGLEEIRTNLGLGKKELETKKFSIISFFKKIINYFLDFFSFLF